MNKKVKKKYKQIYKKIQTYKNKRNTNKYIIYKKVGDTVIGTHFIDLSSISSDGEKVKNLDTMIIVINQS